MIPMTRPQIELLVRSTELYGRRGAVLSAFGSGAYDQAAALCREAMNEAAERARYHCAPIGPEGHKRNFQAIRELRSAIRHLSHETS